jgi:colanic acid biosynthesis protein WcaH
MLPLSDFKKIIKLTPLISIDLIVRSPEGKILLGK